jgi:arylsulfatase A-like enzyme
VHKKLLHPGLLLLIILALAACGQAEDPQARKPNILLISIDTLRSDHLGCYGYERATSPNIDRLASAGAVFENMMAPSPWTLPSHASMFTGLYPSAHGLQNDGVKLGPKIPTLAEILKRGGYHTMAVVSHIYVSRSFGLERGFDVFDDTLLEGGATNPIARQVVDRFVSLMARDASEPFFGFIHFFDPHTDYTPPPPYDTRFTDPAYRGDIDGTMRTLGPYFFPQQAMPEADRRQALALYDGEIAYVDAEIGRLIDVLTKKGFMAHTLVILTSDHGEEFKEHGQLGHARTLFEEQLSVPLIIAGHDSFPAGTRRRELVSTCDIAPTVLALAGIDHVESFQGASLLTPPGTGRPAVAETIRFGFEKRAARMDRFKVIDVLHEKQRFFYDLARDPGERDPLDKDPTGGSLSHVMDDFNAGVGSGWHLKLIALGRNTVRCRAVIRSGSALVNPRYYFSDLIPDTDVDFRSFDISPEGKTLHIAVDVYNTIAEIIFDTGTPEAPVRFEIEIEGRPERAGIFLGAGEKAPDGGVLTMKQSDPGVGRAPRIDWGTAPGIYIRAVRPAAESSPKTDLSEREIERLKSLGYMR